VTVVQRGNTVNGFRYHRTVTLIAALLVPPSTEGQTRNAAVRLNGAVSETVALSIRPNVTHRNIHTDIMSSGSTVRMTLSGIDAESPLISVPLIVRSNSGFRISAVVESKTALLTQVSVIDVRATGTLVSPAAISELDVPQQFDLRGLDDEVSSKMSSSPLDVSRPLLVLSGPRVSLGGTLDSPNNALQITLLIRLKLQPGSGWSVHLTFAGTAVNLL
jgi:hypothetical protein